MTSIQIRYPAHISRRRSGELRRPRAAQPEGVTDLRLLVELAALRKLAERGLSDHELSAIRELADATMRSARTGNVLGYRQADVAFHLYLLDLAGDLALSEVARLVLAAGSGHAPHEGETSQLMAAGAGEHREIVNKLADDLAGAAGDLLRHHICPPSTARTAASRGAPSRDPLATRGG